MRHDSMMPGLYRMGQGNPAQITYGRIPHTHRVDTAECDALADVPVRRENNTAYRGYNQTTWRRAIHTGQVHSWREHGSARA